MSCDQNKMILTPEIIALHGRAITAELYGFTALAGAIRLEIAALLTPAR